MTGKIMVMIGRVTVMIGKNQAWRINPRPATLRATRVPGLPTKIPTKARTKVHTDQDPPEDRPVRAAGAVTELFDIDPGAAVLPPEEAPLFHGSVEV